MEIHYRHFQNGICSVDHLIKKKSRENCENFKLNKDIVFSLLITQDFPAVLAFIGFFTAFL